MNNLKQNENGDVNGMKEINRESTKNVCENITKKLKHNRLTLQQFIERANKIHENKYDYSNSVYINGYTKIEIICKKHESFWQLAENHINSGHGCPKCSCVSLRSQNEFIRRSELVHGNLYDYSKSVYVGGHKNVIIVCKIHGEFSQQARHHWNGAGCSICYYQISSPEIKFLDYLKVVNRNYKLPEWKHKSVDGFDPEERVVYEFLGDYWHGNPELYDAEDYNKTCRKTFGELLDKTVKTLFKISSFDYKVKYIWERDWGRFENKEVNTLKINEI